MKIELSNQIESHKMIVNEKEIERLSEREKRKREKRKREKRKREKRKREKKKQKKFFLKKK